MANARKAHQLHVIGGSRKGRMLAPSNDAGRFGPLGKAPSWLPVEAKKLWREIDGSLGRAGVLTALDRSMLATYCDLWAERVAARKAGETLPASHAGAMTSIASRLGLTAVDRAKMHLPQPRAADPLDELLGAS
jgi:phage terminase small subunit